MTRMVAEKIVPHYRTLSGDVALGLEADGEDAVIAIQRWPSRPSLEEVTTGARFAPWWRDHQPTLAEWDALVVFDREWETEDLLG